MDGKGTSDKIFNIGVPILVQWLTNPTRNHEVAGLILGLAQWVKDLMSVSYTHLTLPTICSV